MEKRKPVTKVDEVKDESRECYYCPACRKALLSTMGGRASGRKSNYCPDCGQRIDWDGVKINTYFPM